MADFDIELVGKIGSMALIDREYQDMNYNIIARLSRELRPGFVWVTSGATEIGARAGNSTAPTRRTRRTIPRKGSPSSCRLTGSSSTAVSA